MPLDTPDHKFIVHCCNDQGAWGSGFVIPLGKKYPKAEQDYRNCFASDNPNKPELGAIRIVKVEDPIYNEGEIKQGAVSVVNMIGQHKTGFDENGRAPVRYIALSESLMKLSNAILGRNRGLEPLNASIHAPLFGAKLAGGDWDIIEHFLQECFIDNDIPVTIYQLEGQELRPSENFRQRQ